MDVTLPITSPWVTVISFKRLNLKIEGKKRLSSSSCNLAVGTTSSDLVRFKVSKYI